MRRAVVLLCLLAGCDSDLLGAANDFCSKHPDRCGNGDGGVVTDGGAGKDGGAPDDSDAGRYVQLALGSAHSCALRENGSVFCWGQNDEGELGGADASVAGEPTRVAGKTRFTRVGQGTGTFDRVSCSYESACAWNRSTGTLYCWGLIINSGVPQQMGIGQPWREASVGRRHACGLNQAGELFCWGSDDRLGMTLSDGGRQNDPVRTRSSDSWKALAGGNDFSCGINTAGRAFCWGDNARGVFGTDSGTIGRGDPVEVSTPSNFDSIAASDHHVCAVTTDGEVECWGDNGYSELGRGGHSSLPQRVPGTDYKGVSVGAKHVCATHRSGLVSCWGRGDKAQVDGSARAPAIYCWGADRNRSIGLPNAGSNLPTEITDAGSGYSQVAVSNTHACGIRGFDVFCWGANDVGQLGLGTTSSLEGTRRASVGPRGFQSITATNGATCVAGTTHLYCWGYGFTATPTRVEGPSWESVSMSGSTVCGTDPVNNNLSCFGSNQHGKLGNGQGVLLPGRVPRP